MKCKHDRPRRRRCRDGGFFFVSPLFQSVYRPQNLIKPRLPSGSLPQNQGAFIRQIKCTTASGYFYMTDSDTFSSCARITHHILILCWVSTGLCLGTFCVRLCVNISLLFILYGTYILKHKN